MPLINGSCDCPNYSGMSCGTSSTSVVKVCAVYLLRIRDAISTYMHLNITGKIHTILHTNFRHRDNK